VLLPNEKAQRVCRDVNSSIGGKIDFTNTWKTPHISLLMWVVDEDKISQIQEVLEKIFQKYSPIITTSHLKTYIISNTWETGHSFELDKHQEVDSLFQDIVTQVRPMLEYKNISTDMFYMPEEVEKQSIEWIKWFENKAVEQYSSHITLWIWELTWDNPNMFCFESNKIAVYQLGNYCTCENKLFEMHL
jgi:hypothetical protein